jgi:hypothetical protein
MTQPKTYCGEAFQKSAPRLADPGDLGTLVQTVSSPMVSVPTLG